MFTDKYMGMSPEVKEQIDRGININDVAANMNLKMFTIELDAGVVEAIKTQLPQGPFTMKMTAPNGESQQYVVHFIDKMAVGPEWVMGVEEMGTIQ
jgi:hypothetical protein